MKAMNDLPAFFEEDWIASVIQKLDKNNMTPKERADYEMTTVRSTASEDREMQQQLIKAKEVDKQLVKELKWLEGRQLIPEHFAADWVDRTVEKYSTRKMSIDENASFEIMLCKGATDRAAYLAQSKVSLEAFKKTKLASIVEGEKEPTQTEIEREFIIQQHEVVEQRIIALVQKYKVEGELTFECISEISGLTIETIQKL